MQKMFGFANRKRTKRNTGEETLDWNRDCLSYDSSAAKLPYSYYPQGKRAVEPFVRILTEPLGLSQKIYHHPTGRQFFNEVEGFVINDKLTVLRYYGYGVYPGPYGALTMDIEAPDKIEPVDFDEGCSFIVVK